MYLHICVTYLYVDIFYLTKYCILQISYTFSLVPFGSKRKNYMNEKV